MLLLLQTGMINKIARKYKLSIPEALETDEIALSTSLQIHNGSRNQENAKTFPWNHQECTLIGSVIQLRLTNQAWR